MKYTIVMPIFAHVTYTVDAESEEEASEKAPPKVYADTQRGLSVEGNGKLSVCLGGAAFDYEAMEVEEGT